MARTGRPKKFTQSQVVEVLKQTRGQTALAARVLGCAYSTLRNYANRYPEVQKTIDEQLALRLDIAETMLDRAVREGQPWAIAFFLKTKGKGRGYSERAEIVHQAVETLEIVPFNYTDAIAGLRPQDEGGK